MNKRSNDPPKDHGFYADIPRVVRTGYKQVSPMQKWVYVCLKDLCGEGGLCFRTIRTLSDEIGLSEGMISETIPVLHEAGLIHAEKKKRRQGGKPVWHISIVDIWGLNGRTHPTKRSQNEQTPNVQDMNVHHTNETPEECSPHEHECSPHETEEESISSITEEESGITSGGFADRKTPEQPPLFSSEEKGEMHTSRAPEKKLSAVKAPPSEEKVVRRVRKPRTPVPPQPKVPAAEVEQYLDLFDELIQTVTEDSSSAYARTKVNEKCVETLLKTNFKTKNFVTLKKLRIVYMSLYQTPRNEKTGFAWADNMTIKAICNNYENEALRLTNEARLRRQQNQQMNQAGQPRPTVSGMKRFGQ